MKLGIAVAVLWFAVAVCGCGISRSSVVAEVGYNCGETEANFVVDVPLMTNKMIPNEPIASFTMPAAAYMPLQWHYKMGHIEKFTWNYGQLNIKVPLGK